MLPAGASRLLVVALLLRITTAFSVNGRVMSLRECVISPSKLLKHASSSDDEGVTILGLGSLLSVASAKTTFPELRNFRLGRVPNYRRVFGHPAPIFFQRGIADMETLQISSLCAEPAEDSKGFICSVFEVPNDDIMENGIPSKAFLEREHEFDIVTVPFFECEDGTITSKGVLCTKSTDETYFARWGKDYFEKQYGTYGVTTIWNWELDSGLRPCAVYLRHCALAARNMGPMCYDSFLDETYLVDRKTTIREYLKQYPEIMNTLPPPELALRYGG